MEQNLRVPGPTPLPAEVMAALGRQMINHRGPEFKEILAETTAGLKRVYQTENDVFTFPASGSGGMEAAVVNMFSPGDRVLIVVIGAFGNRFVKIATAYGLDVDKLEFAWGKAADPAVVEERLASGSYKGVFVQHNETSTGVTNDVEAIAKVVKRRGLLLVVDAVSSMGAVDLRTDEWGCDVVVSGSQKAYMIPPGLVMVSVSEQAWQAHAEARCPRFYWDFSDAKKFLEKGQTPTTPAVSLFYGLQVSLQMMEKEGLPAIFARHAALGKLTRDGAVSLGLELFADPAYASNTVTAIKGPDGVDVKALNKCLREEFGIVLAGGQAHLEGKIFRIGHLGCVSAPELQAVIDTLRDVLPRFGFKPAQAQTVAGKG
jgi:aspartate aminotransferase-like enzyme